MPRRKTTMIAQTQTTKGNFTWIRAVYHFHVFHYRMPETVAIAAVTPFVPSPLTVKMAMIASLFQLGYDYGAKKLAEHMHEIEVKIVPPKSAITFKAFLRYRSPPAVESDKKVLDETGSYYPSRPHIREYAIFEGNISIYVKIPRNLKEIAKKALQNIRYLGAKDSLVSVINVTENAKPTEEKCIKKITEEKIHGVVVLLADFNDDLIKSDVNKLLPSQREEKDYKKDAYVIPGKILTRGKAKLFIRDGKDDL